MPSKPKKPCSQPGCPELTPNGGRCSEHRKQATKQRYKGTSASRYNDPQWTAFRKDYIYRNGYCVLCGALSVVVDHFPKSRRALIAEGIANPDQDRYVRALCRVCHSKETAKHQPGGFVAETRTESPAEREWRRWTDNA